jgi:hypothetical protein
MGTRAFAVLVAVVFGGVIGACKSDLREGRCDKDSDCLSKKCDLSETGNGRCLSEDGGSGDAKDGSGEDASDGGDAHDAFSCEVATCGGETPVCDMAMMKCRKCGAASECMTLSAPVCAPTGACVACVASTDCSEATPICTVATNTCAKCADDGQCKDRAPAIPACAASGKCVECTAHTHCGTTKPICDIATNTCGLCKVADNKCAARDKMKPVCTTTGTCVECVAHADCKDDAKPFCDTTSNTCTRCKADAECTSGPKVCMSHDNGRCASDDETIYVQATGNCASTVGAASGTSTVPYCSMEPALAAFGAMTSRTLIVVRAAVDYSPSGFGITGRQVSIVGQMNAKIAGGSKPAINLQAGDLFVRSVALSSSASVGCQAITGTTLRLDHVLVTANPSGGILLDGAAFDIKDTTVTNNGPGVFNGAVDWGGIFVNNPPAAGPTKLQRVTVQNNMEAGVKCSVALMTTMISGILASGNKSPDIHPTCMVSACGAASATCGAQP